MDAGTIQARSRMCPMVVAMSVTSSYKIWIKKGARRGDYLTARSLSSRSLKGIVSVTYLKLYLSYLARHSERNDARTKMQIVKNKTCRRLLF